MNPKLSRRDFIRTAGLSSLTLFTPFLLKELNPLDQERLFVINPNLPPEDVFGLSVASGDPTASGVILWTRVNPEVWQTNSQLAFEVATDEGFGNIVLNGVVDSADFASDRDYTLKIDVDGMLMPAQLYYYRFIYLSTASQTGRCRTLPHPLSSPPKVTFGVVTCQYFANGYYGALHKLAEEDVDFVIHLGDFIYESAGQSSTYPDRNLSLPSGHSAAINLEDYRYLYRSYRSDPFLQEVMARHTFINVWDDHEFANDSYWDYGQDSPGAPDHEYSANPAALTQLKLDSQRAWSEYLPARPPFDPTATHPHDALATYRQFQFGNLAELFMTDERTYRSPHPCGEGGIGDRYVTPGCEAQQDPTRTMLGTEQRTWLLNSISSSTAIWKVWGNEVLQMRLAIPLPGQDPNTPLEQLQNNLYANLDAWDGYEAERADLLTQFKNINLKNLILLTGDLHTYMAGYVKINYDDNSNNNPANVVGIEFMTPSVTSANLAETLGLEEDFGEGLVRVLNRHVRFFNSFYWGYSVVEFAPMFCRYTAYRVDKTQNSPDVSKELLKQLVVLRDNTYIFDTTP